MVLYFSLVALLSDYDANKHSSIVEHINWVFIRAVSWSAQNGESHWSHVHITLTVERIDFHAFYKCGLQRDLMSCLSCLTLKRQ